jgi:hypothetical protein
MLVERHIFLLGRANQTYTDDEWQRQVKWGWWQTCTATLAMLWGVTAFNPMSEATFEWVAVEFFEHLQGGSLSLCLVFSVTEDGYGNIDL